MQEGCTTGSSWDPQPILEGGMDCWGHRCPKFPLVGWYWLMKIEGFLQVYLWKTRGFYDDRWDFSWINQLPAPTDFYLKRTSPNWLGGLKPIRVIEVSPAIEAMAIEIVDLPSDKMVDLSIAFCMFTRGYVESYGISFAINNRDMSDIGSVHGLIRHHEEHVYSTHKKCIEDGMFGMITLPSAISRGKKCQLRTIPPGNRWYTIGFIFFGYPMFGLTQMYFDSWFCKFCHSPGKNTCSEFGI